MKTQTKFKPISKDTLEYLTYTYALQYPQKKLIRCIGHSYDYSARKLQHLVSTGLIQLNLTQFSNAPRHTIHTFSLTKLGATYLKQNSLNEPNLTTILKSQCKGHDKKQRQLRLSTTLQMFYPYIPNLIPQYLSTLNGHAQCTNNTSNERFGNIKSEIEFRKKLTQTSKQYCEANSNNFPAKPQWLSPDISFKYPQNQFITLREIRTLLPKQKQTITSERALGIFLANSEPFIIYNHLKRRMRAYGTFEEKFKYMAEEITSSEVTSSIHFGSSYKILLDTFQKSSDEARNSYILSNEIYQKQYFVPLSYEGHKQLEIYMIPNFHSKILQGILQPCEIRRAQNIIFDGISENNDHIFLGFECDYNRIRRVYDYVRYHNDVSLTIYCLPHQEQLYRTLFSEANLQLIETDELLQYLKQAS